MCPKRKFSWVKHLLKNQEYALNKETRNLAKNLKFFLIFVEGSPLFCV